MSSLKIESYLREHKDKFLHKKSALIFTNNLDIVCFASKPIVYVNSIDELPLNDINSIEYAEDATLIRLYYSNDKWYTSTRGTVDARESKFGCKYSFDELFWDIFDKETLPLLDTDSTYCFLLKHPEHRFILQHTNKMLMLVEVICKNPTIGEMELPFQGVNTITTHFQLIENKKDYIENIVKRIDKRGLLFIADEKKYLLNFESFLELQRIRGKSSSLLKRYCELYFRPKKRQEFLDNFCQDKLELFIYADSILKEYKKKLPNYKAKNFKNSQSMHLFNIIESNSV